MLNLTFTMLFIVRTIVFFTLVTFMKANSLEPTSIQFNKTYSTFESMSVKQVKILFKKNGSSYHFIKMILPLLLNERTRIEINTTFTIPFYKIEQVARTFPLVQSYVKFNTTGRIYNRSAKITKLQTAFHHLCKMLRHP